MNYENVVFIAWSRLSTRTKILADELGIKLIFISGGAPYIKNWFKTKEELELLKPRVVFVQLPQGPLLFRVLELARKQRFHVIADVHTGFACPASLKEKLINAPFRKLLRRCSLVLAQSEALREYLITRGFSRGDNTLILYDPVGRPMANMEPYDNVEPGKYILVPATWAYDEPLLFIVKEYVLSRVSEKGGYKLVITGNYRRRVRLANNIMHVKGVVLTGFVPDEIYHWLVANAALVIAATTRKCTALMRALWDAVLYETPVAVSWAKMLEKEITAPCFFRYKEGDLAKLLELGLRNEEWRNLNKQMLRELKMLSDKTLENLKSRLRELL